mmetsp:Transcript_102527/g.325883  ORF Transcript_102527/g.325883 Transcript_102527/m.325883 type:complete len:329 (+) Transcript_102527:755-1741(+)
MPHLPILAVGLLELQEGHQHKPQRDPEPCVRYAVDLEKLAAQGECPKAGAASKTSAVAATALEEKRHQVEQLRYAKHMSLGLNVSVAEVPAQRRLLAPHREVEAGQEHRLHAHAPSGRQEGLDEQVVVLGDDVPVLRVSRAAGPADMLERRQRHSVGRKGDLKLERVMGAHHLLRRDHDIDLPAGRSDLPKVAGRYHARLPDQVMPVIPHAEEVCHIREVVWVVERVSVRDVDNAVLLVKPRALADVGLYLRSRPLEVRRLAPDLPRQARRVEGGKHVAEVWPQLVAQSPRLLPPSGALALLHREHQGDLPAAEAGRALRHEGVGKQA